MRLITLLAILVLGGCVIAVNTDDLEDHDRWKSRQTKNEKVIDRLEIGDSQDDIRADLGKPDFRESFVRNGSTYNVLYYRTRHIDSDGETTKDETTPLVFVNGELVGWGESAVEHAVIE